MSIVLDASGAALLVCGVLALVYEMWALFVNPSQTISDIVQRWGKQHPKWLGIIEAVVFTGLAVLGIHFLGGF